MTLRIVRAFSIFSPVYMYPQYSTRGGIETMREYLKPRFQATVCAILQALF